MKEIMIRKINLFFWFSKSRARPAFSIFKIYNSRAMKFTTGSLCLFASGTYGAAPASFDCEMRKLAVDFASSKIPSSSTKVWEALELGVKCDAPPPAAHSTTLQATDLKLDPSAAIYVDINGDDGNKGTIDAPLQSLQQAVDMSRASGLHTILLNTGTHYIADTITLDSRDSGTTFAASANHSPIISGARPLPNLQWAEHDINNGKNIYVADIPSDLNLASIPGLHYSEGVYGNVGRATKARFPNAEQWKMDEENGGDARISEGVATWMDPIDYSNDPTFTQVFVESPARENTPDGLFQNYVQGVGGPCEIYDPPTSYWCSNATQGGGAFTFRVPSGIYLDPSFLPNLPYASGAPQVSEAELATVSNSQRLKTVCVGVTAGSVLRLNFVVSLGVRLFLVGVFWTVPEQNLRQKRCALQNQPPCPIHSV